MRHTSVIGNMTIEYSGDFEEFRKLKLLEIELDINSIKNTLLRRIDEVASKDYVDIDKLEALSKAYQRINSGE